MSSAVFCCVRAYERRLRHIILCDVLRTPNLWTYILVQEIKGCCFMQFVVKRKFDIFWFSMSLFFGKMIRREKTGEFSTAVLKSPVENSLCLRGFQHFQQGFQQVLRNRLSENEYFDITRRSPLFCAIFTTIIDAVIHIPWNRNRMRKRCGQAIFKKGTKHLSWKKGTQRTLYRAYLYG